MKVCYYHKNQEANYKCKTCDNPICDKCIPKSIKTALESNSRFKRFVKIKCFYCIHEFNKKSNIIINFLGVISEIIFILYIFLLYNHIFIPFPIDPFFLLLMIIAFFSLSAIILNSSYIFEEIKLKNKKIINQSDSYFKIFILLTINFLGIIVFFVSCFTFFFLHPPKL